MSRLRSAPRIALVYSCSVVLFVLPGNGGLHAQTSPPGVNPPSHPPHMARHARKEAKQEVEELEEQWKNATLNGDVNAMDKLLSEDYVGISWTGQVNTKQMQLDRIRKRMVAIKSMELSDIKVKVVGPVAIVTSRAEVEGINDGSQIDGAFRYTRVYQRLPGGIWKITNFEATRIPSGEREHKPPPAPTTP